MNMVTKTSKKNYKGSKTPQQSVSCFLLYRLSCKWVINEQKILQGKPLIHCIRRGGMFCHLLRKVNEEKVSQRKVLV